MNKDKTAVSSAGYSYRFLNLELNTKSSRGSTRAVRQIVVRSLVEFISLVVVRKGMKATSIASM